MNNIWACITTISNQIQSPTILVQVFNKRSQNTGVIESIELVQVAECRRGHLRRNDWQYYIKIRRRKEKNRKKGKKGTLGKRRNQAIVRHRNSRVFFFFCLCFCFWFCFFLKKKKKKSFGWLD